MDRGVQVCSYKRTGAFLLNPVGTFRGYGACVGINPYRELPVTAPDESLGQAIVDLLVLSGPTGIAFAEAKQFLEESQDDETVRIRRQYGLDRPGLMTTAKLARQFLQASVEQQHGQKSWVVQPFCHSSRRRLMSGEDLPAVRVRHSAGSAALGAALRAAIVLALSESR